MFQLFSATLLTCLTLSSASYQVYHPMLHVASLVEHVPTAVSHQSSTIVHSTAPRVTPLVAAATRSYAVPALQLQAMTPAAAYVHAHAGSYAQPAWSYHSNGGIYLNALPIYRK